MIGKKVVHHMMMSEKDAHYVGGLVNGARIVVQWGDVGTELMVYADGDISLFLGYEKIEFTAPVYVGDFMGICRMDRRSRKPVLQMQVRSMEGSNNA